MQQRFSCFSAFMLFACPKSSETRNEPLFDDSCSTYCNVANIWQEHGTQLKVEDAANFMFLYRQSYSGSALLLLRHV